MASFLALVCSIGLVSCSNAASRAQIDLQQFVKNHDKDWPYLNAVDITADECQGTGCVQAVKSAYVSLLKFDSAKEAAHFAEGCDCQAIDPLVIRFDGKAVSTETRRDIVNTMSNINADSPD